MIPHFSFDFHSLVTSDDKYLFMCPLAICMSSSEECLFGSSAQFFDWIVCFDDDKPDEIIYKFWRIIPCWSHRMKIFSPTSCVAVSFCLLFPLLDKSS